MSLKPKARTKAQGVPTEPGLYFYRLLEFGNWSSWHVGEVRHSREMKGLVVYSGFGRAAYHHGRVHRSCLEFGQRVDIVEVAA